MLKTKPNPIEILVDQQLERLPDVLVPSEMVKLFGVNERTITRWKIPGTFKTLGGHKRYPKPEVRVLLIAHLTEKEAHKVKKQSTSSETPVEVKGV